MEFKRIVTQHMRLRLVLKDSQAINPGNCFLCITFCYKSRLLKYTFTGWNYNGFVKIKSKVEQVVWKVSNVRNADNSVLLKELKTLSTPKLAHRNIFQMVMHVNING